MRRTNAGEIPTIRVGPVQLDLDDLLEIESLFLRNGSTKVTVDSPVPGYEFDDVADLKNSPIAVVDNCAMWSEEGTFYARVEIWKKGADVSGSAYATELDGQPTGAATAEAVAGIVRAMGDQLRSHERSRILRILRRPSVIALRHKSEKAPSFWERRGDDVLVAVISAFVGGIIVFAFGHL
jgi:hypothetical protein